VCRSQLLFDLGLYFSLLCGRCFFNWKTDFATYWHSPSGESIWTIELYPRKFTCSGVR